MTDQPTIQWPIVAIRADNAFFFAAPNHQRLTEHALADVLVWAATAAQTWADTFDAAPSQQPELEFFDCTGRRLIPMISARWVLIGLRATPLSIGEAGLRDRITVAAAAMDAHAQQLPGPEQHRVPPPGPSLTRYLRTAAAKMCLPVLKIDLGPVGEEEEPELLLRRAGAPSSRARAATADAEATTEPDHAPPAINHHLPPGHTGSWLHNLYHSVAG